MNKPGTVFRILAALSALIAIPGPVVAQTADTGKIGVIDLQRAVEENSYYHEAAEQWTEMMTSQSAEITLKQEELRTAQERLATQQRGLNERARANLVSEIDRLQTEFERMSEDLQQDLNALREQLLLPITERVDDAIRAHVQENGFTLILDASNPRTGSLFVGDSIDITDDVLSRLENTVPAPAEIAPQ